MKSLIITGKYVQDHEYIYPYYRLQELGEVDVVTPEYPNESLTYFGVKILANRGIPRIEEAEDYDLLVLPGGAKCMEYLRQNQEVLDFIDEFNDLNKPIASICHGAQLLISSIYLKGKDVAGYYSIRDDIENAGARYCEIYCQDGNLITASHYKYMPQWMEMIVKCLKS